MTKTPRLRMFAGPDGSGKSTINGVVYRKLLGVYINSDEIEKVLKIKYELNFADFSVKTTYVEVMNFFKQSSLLASKNYLCHLSAFEWKENSLIFPQEAANSYFASVVSDFIRHKLLDLGVSFTFETVMSSRDKVDFLAKAQRKGFRTYLYFVATDDPEINVTRVQHRIKMGGHPVPEDKIRARYYRSLSLLADAVKYSDRAYIFDNSSQSRLWLAEVTNGAEMEIKSEWIPDWLIQAFPLVFLSDSESTYE